MEVRKMTNKKQAGASLKEVILEKVESACKATELFLYVVSQYCESGRRAPTFGEIEREVSLLVERGDIVEFDYVLPSMDYRVKTIYFPKGVELRLKH